MHHASVFRSTGFRLSMAFLMLSIAAGIVAAAAAYSVIAKELNDAHQRNIEQEFTLFENEFNDGGQDALVESVDAHVNITNDKSTVYLLVDSAGKKIAGSLDISAKNISSGTADSQSLSLAEDFRYFVKKAPIGTMTLLVGISAEDISEVEEIFRDGAFWALLPLLAISLSGGLALSASMNRRISGIEQVLETVAAGRFDVAMPQSGKGDDIDRISSLMDNAISKLGHSVEANRQISADIAHDLKTPINRLRISVEKALELNEAHKPVGGELEQIDIESNAILKTFDALLRIAQIEGGARKSRFEDVNLGKIFAEVGGFYQSHAEETGARFSVYADQDLPDIHGDRELLIQLISNLIENALKHAGQQPEVDCRVKQIDGSVVLTVADNGPGIPANEREKVTRRLYRLEKSRTTPGNGLGLSMVKAIAELHKAKLVLGDNQPGLIVTLTFSVKK